MILGLVPLLYYDLYYFSYYYLGWFPHCGDSFLSWLALHILTLVDHFKFLLGLVPSRSYLGGSLVFLPRPVFHVDGG